MQCRREAHQTQAARLATAGDITDGKRHSGMQAHVGNGIARPDAGNWAGGLSLPAENLVNLHATAHGEKR